MKQAILCIFIMVIGIRADDSGAADFVVGDAGGFVLKIEKQQLAGRFFIYTLSLQNGREEIGWLRFKFFNTVQKPKSSEIDCIIIKEGRRDQGFGDQLLKAALHIMGDLNCKEVKAGVHSDNLPSQQLFKKNGFSKEEPGIPFILGGEMFLMKKQL